MKTRQVFVERINNSFRAVSHSHLGECDLPSVSQTLHDAEEFYESCKNLNVPTEDDRMAKELVQNLRTILLDIKIVEVVLNVQSGFLLNGQSPLRLKKLSYSGVYKRVQFSSDEQFMSQKSVDRYIGQDKIKAVWMGKIYMIDDLINQGKQFERLERCVLAIQNLVEEGHSLAKLSTETVKLWLEKNALNEWSDRSLHSSVTLAKEYLQKDLRYAQSQSLGVNNMPISNRSSAQNMNKSNGGEML